MEMMEILVIKEGMEAKEMEMGKEMEKEINQGMETDLDHLNIKGNYKKNIFCILYVY